MKKLVLAVVAMFVFSGAVFSENEFNIKVSLDPYGKIKREGYEKEETVLKTEQTTSGFLTKLPKQDKIKTSSTPKFKDSIAVACEYLFSVNDYLKLGLGFEYLPTREYDYYDDYIITKENIRKYTEYSWLPMYFTAKVSPIPSARGVFIKGSIGYAMFFSDEEEFLRSEAETTLDYDNSEKIKWKWYPDLLVNQIDNETLLRAKSGKWDTLSVKNKGGLYYAASVGYEFSSGLTLDLTYSHYTSFLSESGLWSWSASKLSDIRTSYNSTHEMKNSYDINYGKISINIGYKFRF
jgi:hypothetical protein